jgi:hypothetical protein
MDPFFAEEQEATVSLERRAMAEYLDYVTFIAHKPD